jgi:hypothetical protein
MAESIFIPSNCFSFNEVSFHSKLNYFLDIYIQYLCFALSFIGSLGLPCISYSFVASNIYVFEIKFSERKNLSCKEKL